MDCFWIFRRYAPVAIAVVGDDAIVVGFLFDMVEPSDDIVEALGHRGKVTILSVQHIAGKRQGCRPRDVMVV